MSHGPIASDGSPVEFYLQLPPGEDEAAIVASVAPDGGSVLELGCGVGRVTHPLVARGLDVVAVDESAQMLSHVRGALGVCAGIEALHLTRRFDVVPEAMGSWSVGTVPGGPQPSSTLTWLDWPESELVDAEVTYRAGDHTWRQGFRARARSEAALDVLLGRVGLRLDRRLTRDGRWLLARLS